MMIKTSKFLFLALVLCITSTIISCSEDPEERSVCEEGTFTFKLNGEDWVGESFNNTIFFGTDPMSGQEALRCDIRARSAEGDLVILTFTNPNATDDSCVELGNYTPLENVYSSTTNTFFFTYRKSGTITTFATFDGTLNITQCDEENNREMAGTFSFIDLFEENVGTEGVFSVCMPN